MIDRSDLCTVCRIIYDAVVGSPSRIGLAFGTRTRRIRRSLALRCPRFKARRILPEHGAGAEQSATSRRGRGHLTHCCRRRHCRGLSARKDLKNADEMGNSRSLAAQGVHAKEALAWRGERVRERSRGAEQGSGPGRRGVAGGRGAKRTW